MKKNINRLLAALISIGLCTSLNMVLTTANASAAVGGTTVLNQGLRTEPAYIRGSKAEVTYDSTRRSDVLALNGDGFGEGWMQLPSFFDTDCSEGFTFSMKISLNPDADKYTKLFQFSSLPFGTGNEPSYSSPDISVDINDKTQFRASIFAGNRQNTVNDNCHRAIFPISAKPDANVWHELTFVCTPQGSDYYLDGVHAAYEAETADAASASLFKSNMLSYYVYNSIGHSVYSDNDLKARVDDVAFFDRPLSAQDVVSLPLNEAAFLYNFDKNSVQSGSSVPPSETAYALNGTAITSLPTLQVSSPDGNITTKFWKDSSDRYYYSVNKTSGGKSETVVEPSQLGFITTTEDLSGGFSNVPSASEIIHDESYTMPYGKHSSLRDYCREISFSLRKGDSVLTVTMRVYNDGIGLRYALNHGATIKEEATQVIFPDTGTFWGNWPNSTYEWDMVEFTTKKITDSWADYSCPLTGKLSDTCWVLLSEANVFNEDDPYCSGCVSTTGGSRALKWKFGIKTESVVMSGAFHTPWRALIIGDDLNEMTGSDLILNLNPPSVLEDTSWIKPGKCAWSWWSSGGDSPIEYHVQKDYIDFAAENGWQFVCLDFGWALWDDSADKVRELCEYGAKRGVGIYLWYGVNNTGHKGYKDSQGNPAYPYYSLLDEETIVREFKRVSAMGVKGVKVDYYESDTQQTMKQMQMCAEIAAENHLMVLFHGCTLPKGESRTYPHVVSYEAVNGTEFYKWGTSPSLANRVSYVFTRNVVGSADFTPTGVPIYGIKATAGFALADTVTIESGIQHFAHSVYTYEGSSALPMLNDIPVTWDELKILDGYPMQFNVTARRSNNDWYIASATLDSRTVEIALSDLISEGTWDAYIFSDNDDGSDLIVTMKKGLTAGDVIRQDLLPNGGFVIKLTQNGMKLSTPTSNYRTYEAEDALLSGDAAITTGSDAKYCSRNGFVGYIGGNDKNAVTFEHVNVDKDGEYTIRIYYLSGEYRDLMVSVNGTYAQTLTGLYANRNDWKGIGAADVTVSLRKGDNVIRLYNDKKYGPNIDRIAVALPEETVFGDVNADGILSVADIVLLQKWLVAVPNTHLANWKSADLCKDEKLDVFDLCLMKRMLAKSS